MRTRLLVCALLLVPALAGADPKNADEWYKQGETEYNLGDFDKAAESFKQGFALETNDEKKPAYLYNVAQAYRQGNKCKDAVFFYKRFLALKDGDTVKPLKASTRAEIEQWIKDLEECAKQQDAIAGKPPQDTIKPGDDGKTGTTGTGTTTAGTGTTTTAGTGTTTHKPDPKKVGSGSDSDTGSGDDDDNSVRQVAPPPPHMISARFIGGAAKISAGGLDVPVQATFTLIAGYPIPINDKLVIDAGIAATFTPVPYQNSITSMTKTASFVTLLADAAATYAVTPKIGLRGDLGAGVLVFSGIDDMGNPFTQDGASTSGALAMAAVRFGISGDYAITQNLIATLAPFAVTYSPAKSGLRSDISSIVRLDFMLGIGYRM